MPVKFIVWNIVAVLSVIILLDIFEPVQGVLPILAILLIFAVLTLISPVFSRYIENSPLPVRAINDGLEKIIRYLWVGWLGWQCHSLYVEIKHTDFAKTILLVIITCACVIYVGANYKKNLEKYKNQTFSNIKK